MTARGWHSSTGFGCGALALAFFVGASAAADPVELPPVVVPLPPEPAPESPARRDPSGARWEVDAGARRGEAKDTAELLAAAPGLVVQDRGGLGQSKSLSIRGASANGVLVLLDGVPLNGAGGIADLSTVPPAIIERLEVVRGGAGARYGSGGLGGVVNVVTRKPTAGARLFAEVTQGSFSTTLAHAGAAGSLAGGQGLLIVHGGGSAGDFQFLHDPQPALEGNPLELKRRENNQALLGGALLKFRKSLGGALVADAAAELSYDARGLAGTAQNPTREADQSILWGALTARAVRSFEGGGELVALAYARRADIRLAGSGFGAGIDQLDSSAGAEVSYSALLAERHGLSATAQLSYEWLREPSGANPGWSRLGAMVSDEILFRDGALALAPSVRVDLSGPFAGLSPKLGATWLLPAGFELRGNVGQAHRAPSFLELYVQQGHLLPNDQLRPERALYADAAVAHRSERAWLSVGGFYSLYEDLISYEYYPPMLARPYNFASARVVGLEVEARATPHPWLSAEAAYALLHSQNLRDDPRYYLKELPYRPRHKAFLRVEGGPRRARARVEVLYQSRQYVNRTQTVALAERAFVNAGVTGELFSAPEVSASLELKNLFDVQAQDLDGYPLPGRAVFVTVAVAWDAAPSAEF